MPPTQNQSAAEMGLEVTSAGVQGCRERAGRPFSPFFIFALHVLLNQLEQSQLPGAGLSHTLHTHQLGARAFSGSSVLNTLPSAMNAAIPTLMWGVSIEGIHF